MCRDLGNRASLVNRAHMKRPSSLIFTVAGERALDTKKQQQQQQKNARLNERSPALSHPLTIYDSSTS